MMKVMFSEAFPGGGPENSETLLQAVREASRAVSEKEEVTIMKMCPNCGNHVEDSARFCNVCGTTVPVTGAEPASVTVTAPGQQVTCGICGAVNPSTASACSVCGAFLGTEAAPEAVPQAPQKDAAQTAKELGGKVAESAREIGGKVAVAAKVVGGKVAVAAKAAGGKLKEARLDEKLKKVDRKVWMIAGGALAVVVLLIILVNVIGGSGGMDYNFAMYVNEDNNLSYTKLTGKGDPMEITEEGYAGFRMADDSKTVFYLDYNEDGELCLYYRNATKARKEPVLLDSKVDGNFAINADGSRVYYMKKGNLYMSNLKKSVKVESDVDGFLLSEDGKKVLYQNDDGELYVWNGKKSTEIDSDVEDLYYWSEDLKEFYYLKGSDLYLKKGSKDGVEVLSDCSSCYIGEDGTGYALNDDGELYYINGKKATEVASDVTSRTFASERAVAVYEVEDEAWFVAVKGKSYELDVEDVSRIRLSGDGKTLYLLLDVDGEHGDLVKISIGGKPGKVKDVDEDVYCYDLDFTEEGKFYYFKNVEDGHGTLIFNGKEVDTEVYYSGYGFMDSKPYYLKDVEDGEGTLVVKGKEVTDGVAVSSVYYNEDKSALLFITEWEQSDSVGTLNYYKSKTKVVAEEVYYSGSDYGTRDFFIMPEGQVLYFTEYDTSDGEGVLNCFNGSKSVELADDAKYYVAIYSYED